MTTLPMQFGSDQLTRSSREDSSAGPAGPATPRKPSSGTTGPARPHAPERLITPRPWVVSLAIHAGLIAIACLTIGALASQGTPPVPVALAHGKTLVHHEAPAMAGMSGSASKSAANDDRSLASIGLPASEPAASSSAVPSSAEPGDRLSASVAEHAKSNASQAVSTRDSLTNSSRQTTVSQPMLASMETDWADRLMRSEPVEPSVEPKQIADSAAVPAFVGSLKSAGNGPFGLDLTLVDGSSPRQVVYVVDASGSLVDTFPMLRRAIEHSIESLNHDQRFTVILFQGGDLLEPAPFGLQAATTERKVEVNRWMRRINPRGRTRPIGAIQRALDYQPDSVVLLSDNITGLTTPSLNQRALLQAIHGSHSQAVIHTVQFLDPDPLQTVPGKTPTLKLIANQTGGHHRFVSLDDLGLSQARR